VTDSICFIVILRALALVTISMFFVSTELAYRIVSTVFSNLFRSYSVSVSSVSVFNIRYVSIFDMTVKSKLANVIVCDLRKTDGVAFRSVYY
jgi:hypothetical protein